ncbi:conserved hypothetical protein [Deferribacter desulfuricans SSM1]|uniref:Thiamine phosphate synthase/TenI domain-containing protein n=1 Tax=Deferribacter desulfuricans (strain DSM 14783 / JCM 11476 / NBRC 101012 / SSM1) TaxID=639282 RepID=D3PA42_DEFDS|nr:thiamine phosphate synthase [Deferribacter desulfuricans]BAI81582.1 conserved hypothetical protein [Deferribacter desulfuricans SSM1]
MLKILQILDFDTFGDKIFDIAVRVDKFVDFFWLRIKNQNTRFIFDTAKNLTNYIDREKIIISEHCDIASILTLHGAHLNKNSIPTNFIKYTFPNLTIGYSAHSIEEIQTIEADYYTLSPIFNTKKSYPVKPLGLDFKLPKNKKIFALGGINKNNINFIINKGFHGIAGIRFFNELKEMRMLLNRLTCR